MIKTVKRLDIKSGIITLEDSAPINDTNVRPLPEFSEVVDASNILGLCDVQDRMNVLADIDRLLTSQDMGLVSLKA